MIDAFEQCVEVVGEESPTRELLRCVSGVLQDEHRSLLHRDLQEGGEDAMEFSTIYSLIFSAVLVFLMQAGFAMVAAGAVRLKNVGNTMLKNLLDACGASFAYFAIGYAISFGGANPASPQKTFIGTKGFFLIDVDNYDLWIFNYAFCASAVTIVAGALAERCQMAAYFCYSLMLGGWVYPVVVHAAWDPQGFLSPYNVEPLWGTGFLDFAGSGVVHMTGGITALLAATILGPRRGRFHDDTGHKLAKPRVFPGHSVALQMLGTFLLWVGWFGFNVGTTLTLENNGQLGAIGSLVAVNTALSAGMGGMSAMFLNLIVLERLTGEPYYDITFLMNGCLSGCVAITGGCAFVEPWAAVIVGFFSGIFYILFHHVILKFRIDDVVDAIPVHLFNGMWGLIAVGLLGSPERIQNVHGRSTHVGWFYSWSRGSGDATLLGAQLVGILFIVGWVVGIMLPFFVWLDWKGWFRSDPLEEIVGLDTSYHGGLVLTGEAQPAYITGPPSKRPEKDKFGGTENDFESDGENVVDAYGFLAPVDN